MTPLLVVTLAWVVGILCAHTFSLPLVWYLLPMPCAAALVLAWWESRWARRGGAALVALSLGALRFVLAQPPQTPTHVVNYVDTPTVQVQGRVIADPDRRAADTRLTLDEIVLAPTTAVPVALDGRILVVAPAHAEVAYGDRIQVTGTLELPPTYDAFSYRDHLARRGVYALLYAGDVDVVASHQGNALMDGLMQLRTRAHAAVQRMLPEPQSSLLAGILLGIEQGLPEGLVEAFARTGTSHIVAISGFNLTLIAAQLNHLLRRFLKRRLQLPVSLVAIWLYVLVVGASPAVLRAGVMSSLAFLALHEQRPVHGPTAVAAAVLFLSVLNPTVLWDLGFRLSLAATLALVIYVPRFTAWFEKPRQWLIDRTGAEGVVILLSNVLIATIAVQLTTLGILVGLSGELSLVALPANLLVLPAQSSVMLFGGLALILGMVVPLVGLPFAWVAWVFLAYTTWVVQWAAGPAWATVTVGTWGPVLVAGYYLLLILVTWWLTRPAPVRNQVIAFIGSADPKAIAAGAAAVVLVVAAVVARPDGRLHVVFLDVGDGDAVFVRAPAGEQALIDGGPDSRRTLAALADQMPFWDRSLDLLVLTSPDDDRLAGLVPVATRYSVERVVTGAEQGRGATWDAWEAALAQRSSGTSIVNAGGSVALGDHVVLRVLWPPAGSSGPLVLAVVYDQTCALLMGDATAVIEQSLVDAYGTGLHCGVLQVARQGAQTSTSVPLLQAVNPELAVVGLGKRHRPSDFVQARLMDILLYHTGDDGAIDVVSNGRTIKARVRR